MSRVTPDSIQGLLLVLEHLQLYGERPIEEVMQNLARTGIATRNFPIESITEIGLRLNLIETHDRHNSVKLSRIGNRLLSELAHSGSEFVLREILMKWILYVDHRLIGLAFSPRKEIQENADSFTRDCLQTLGLLDSTPSQDSKDWWLRLQTASFLPNQEILTQLGEAAESAVLKAEQARLSKAGLANQADKIRQVSVSSNLAGYDILSLNGNLVTDLDKNQSIQIEVKSVRPERDGIGRFFLSRNEWDTAKSLAQTYFLYLVHRQTISSTLEPQITILSVSQLETLLPKDSSSQAKWVTAEVRVALEP